MAAIAPASPSMKAGRRGRRGLRTLLVIAGAVVATTTAVMTAEAFVSTGRPKLSLSATRQSSEAALTAAAAGREGAAGLEDFKAAIQEGMPFVVDFTSPWCGPCKLMNKVLDEVTAEFAGRVRVLKLDVESNPHLAGGFGVRKVPTVLLFPGGSITPVQTFTGLAKGEDISAAIHKQLLG